MKLRRTYHALLAICGVLIFSISAILSQYTAGPTDSNIEFTRSKIKDFLDHQSELGSNISENFTTTSLDSLWKQEHDLPSRWEVKVIEYDKPVFWTSNAIAFDSTLLIEGTHTYRDISGWHLAVVKKHEDRTVAAILPLVKYSRGSINGFSLIDELPGLKVLLTSRAAKTFPIEGYSVKVYFTNQQESVWHVGSLFWIGVILLFFAVVTVRRAPRWMRLVLIILTIVTRVLLYEDHLIRAVKSTKVFSPSIFASSFLLPSLGDLILHIMAGTMILVQLGYIIYSIHWKRKALANAVYLILGTGMLFLIDMIYGFVRGLVLDSHISFDVTSLSQLDVYTVLAVSSIGLCFLTGYYFIHLIGPALKKGSNWIFIYLISTAIYIGFQRIDANVAWHQLILTVVIFGVFLVINQTKGRFWPKAIFLLLVVAGYMTVSIHIHLINKEKEYLQIYSSKLMANKDLDAENLFLDIEKDLVAEFLKPEDFANFQKKKDAFEKRLRRLYFSGYLDKYDLKVLNFDSVGNNLDKSNFISFFTLNELYNQHSLPTLSNYFYQINDPSTLSGYLAKFENCDVNGHYGNVFILLQPKLIQTTYTYPSLIHRKKGGRLIDLADYSYALYRNNRLLQQRGDYPYPMRFDAELFDEESWLVNSYHHFVSDETAHSVVVISQANRKILVYTSTLTFLFLFLGTMMGIGILLIVLIRRGYMRYLRNRGKRGWLTHAKYSYRSFISYWGLEQPLLSSRIQLAMIAIVFLGFVISVYSTIKFVEYNYNQRAQDELIFKLKEVANQLQNEVNTAQKIASEEEKVQLVNQISNSYKLETNLFNTSGELLASSEPELFEEGLLGTMVHPDAFKALMIDNKSQYVQIEHIRDLTYLSAYVPVLDEKRNVIAYLNLPYFTRERELDNEISTYTITLVNVFVLLFIFAFFLAYFVSNRITKPLQIIREMIAKTSLQNKNEQIDWKRNDEIGQLITQYNKMVVELEKSAKKLSESEREGAWKEMARQVAHEIKNPLTPMKLNIQHLQRAWKDQHPKLPETFEKVTKVLIDQIDSLTRLANEFSSFAKMPQNEFETADISKIIESVVDLYDKSENVQFNLVRPNEPVLIYADGEQLKRAFTNIIKNGIQAIPADREGKIDILIDVQKDVMVSISDNGTGISKEQWNKIFVPNFSTKTSGMGLGLAITKKIIETSSGSITFKSKAGEGTTFVMHFPLIEE